MPLLNPDTKGEKAGNKTEFEQEVACPNALWVGASGRSLCLVLSFQHQFPVLWSQLVEIGKHAESMFQALPNTV